MPRLIAFGCSFTYQQYPTWADLLSLSFDSYENYARGGAGHRYILTALQQRLMRGDVSRDDTIVVQWSSSHRFDTYRDGRWSCRGGVHFSDDIMRFSEYRWDPTSAMLETLTSIVSAMHLLSSHGANWYMCQLDGLDLDPRYIELNGRDRLVDGARGHISGHRDRWATEPIHDHCTGLGMRYKEWLEPDGSLFLDMHPTPMMGYTWLRDCLAPVMGIGIDDAGVAVTRMQERFDRCVSRADIAREFTVHDWHCPDATREEFYLDIP